MTPRRTCLLCGWRDATRTARWDGRIVPACARCLAPVRIARPFIDPADLSLSARVVSFARAHEGLTAQEIAEELVLGEDDRNAVSVALSRAVRAGHLVADDANGRLQRRHLRGPVAWEPDIVRNGVSTAMRRKRSGIRRAGVAS